MGGGGGLVVGGGGLDCMSSSEAKRTALAAGGFGFLLVSFSGDPFGACSSVS